MIFNINNFNNLIFNIYIRKKYYNKLIYLFIIYN